MAGTARAASFATASLVAALLLTALPARAEPTASDIVAAQVRATRAVNRQLDAAMSQVKPQRGTPRHAVAAKPRMVPVPAAAPAPAPAGENAVATTAGKTLQVGPLTLTPGGFLELQTHNP